MYGFRLMGKKLSAIWVKHPALLLSLKCHLSRQSNINESIMNYPKKIFSGIQPTGSVHLGNYLGAMQHWVQLQSNQENVTYCIVDMHSITIPQNPPVLRENIFELAATMLACGINYEQSIFFVQSSVPEHCELCWILGCMTTLTRLAHLPQFKEKSKNNRDIPLGVFMYPVLQAADIMLHKATHVPVGEDQIQHIQLAQHLAKIFNGRYGPTIPVCHAMIGNQYAARIRSLRTPTKKMSKSDLDTRATIYLKDEPDVIVDKIKKALTDFTSDVSYDIELRPGVSNLIAIHALMTGQTIEQIIDEAKSIDTGRYKMRVAEAVVEHLKPIRHKITYYFNRRNELNYILEMGAEKACQVAQGTIAEIKQKIGLGNQLNMPHAIIDPTDIQNIKIVKTVVDQNVTEAISLEKSEAPSVPKQNNASKSNVLSTVITV